MIKAEVFYASIDEQKSIQLELSNPTTVKEAILQSKICEAFPEIDLAKQAVGVFGKAVKLDDLIEDGDRIEIYRPLTISPKEARRLRAAKKSKS